MQWDRLATTLRLCSTISTVRLLATDLMSAAMRSMSSCPMPAVGSSSSIISGSRASVVAISSARLRPYGSSTADHSAKGLRPTSASKAMARSLQGNTHILKHAEVREYGRDLERPHEPQAGNLGWPRRGNVASIVEDTTA